MAIIHKTLCLLLISIIFCSCCQNRNKMSDAYNSPKPRKALSQKPCSFAKVIDVKYKYDFNSTRWTIEMKIRNESDTVLFVSDVPSGCSCFRAQFSKKPIGRHGITNIKAVYEADKHDKGFVKPMTIIFNNGRFHKLILLRHDSKNAARANYSHART
ncbi:MAG TPA: hypothetical protein DEQ17_02375 [Prevotella sp.]|nr:hypothetical protein [Prevotella sp.]